MMNRGNRIKERRKSLHMSADELADIVGINRATIYRYEAGDIKKIDVEIMRRIAVALRTSVAYLTGETDDPEPSVWDRPLRDDALVLTADEELLIRKLRELPDRDRDYILRVLDSVYSAFMHYVTDDEGGSDDAGL